MDEFKNHIAPFVLGCALALYLLTYVVKSFIAWRRDGSLGVRNRIRWMPGGVWVAMASDLVRGDPTDKRPVHQLKNPVVVLFWLSICLALAGFVFYAGYNYLRYGHSL